MNDKKVLISAGVHDRSWILPHYLQHIYNIIYDKKLLDLYFIVNNCSDNSLELLQEFKDKYNNEYNSIIIEIMNNSKIPKDERKTNVREGFIYEWLCKIRNKIFSKCIELDCDNLLSVDTDILVPENIINDLLETNKDICSSLIWNGTLFAGIENAYKYPNILKLENGSYKHIVNYYVKNPDKSPKDKIIEVDATGAVSLISKEVCKNTFYINHPQGEDMGWADVCREKGYKMYCLPYCFSKHVMDKSLLHLYI